MTRRLLALLLLACCATAAAKHVYPRSLAPVTEGAVYTLAEDYVYKEKAATFTLAAGRYAQKYEDRGAIYLIGEGQCLEMGVVPPKNPAAAYSMRFECGIFLPKDPRKGAAFFVIRATPQEPSSGNGLIIDAIIHAGYGSFNFPTSKHDDAVLRAKLLGAEPDVALPQAK